MNRRSGGGSGRRGSSLLEAALFIPFLITLMVATEQLGKLTYTYFTLRKTLYAAARYIGTQQGVNFCDPGDPAITAGINFALTGTTDGSVQPFVQDLTADKIQVTAERYDASSQTLGPCFCSITGCDTAAGGGAPDFIIVAIPDGYQIKPNIPFLTLDPILFRPSVKIPYGGT